MLLPLFSRKRSTKQLLSLVISEGTVAAALWNVTEAGPKVIKTSDPIVWNSEAEASLIEASDVALEDLGNAANTVKEVLLGLPEHWAEHQAIAPDKKHMLKKLTDQLNLKSVGFVITQEAITALFRDREHTGCNALLVFVSQKNIYLLSILHGKASESVNVGRSDSLVKDILEGCARGNFSSLPARILLASQDLSGDDLTAVQHELESHVWDEKLFVHIPRIDTVSSHLILEAVSVAGGKEVARALGILKEGVQPEEEPTSSVAMGFKPVAADEKESSEDDADEEEQEDEEETEEDAPLDFGIQKPLGLRPRVPKAAMIFIGILLFLGVTSVLAYVGTTSIARANVAVVIKTEPVSFDTIMTIDANAGQTDPSSDILKATQRTKEVNDTAQAITSGTKTIGDKATGSVTIYNRTTVGDKVFKAGTLIKLDDKVSYTLDTDVTVPLGTKDTSPPYQGSATVKVTAANIGAESNIDDKTELTVASFDKASFVALTNGKFAGGASRTIQVVSEDDQKKLSDKLFAQLKDKALAAFNGEANSNEHVILSDKVNITKKQFSDDIGKEVKSFTLTMSVSAQAIVYTNDDIVSFATAKLASQIPAGAVLKSDRTVITVQESKAISDTKTVLKATIASVIIPAFDTIQIAAVLAGKPLEDATAFLGSQHAIDSYTISFTPTFATKILHRMPTRRDRIHIATTVQ